MGMAPAPRVFCLSPDGRLVAQSDVEGRLCVVETATLATVMRHGSGLHLTAACWNGMSTAAFFATAEGAVICAYPVVGPSVWRTNTIFRSASHVRERLVHLLLIGSPVSFVGANGHAQIHHVQIDANDRWIALACADASIAVLDILHGFRALRRLDGFVSAVVRCAFSCDGRFLVGIDDGGRTTVYSDVDGVWLPTAALSCASPLTPTAWRVAWATAQPLILGGTRAGGGGGDDAAAPLPDAAAHAQRHPPPAGPRSQSVHAAALRPSAFPPTLSSSAAAPLSVPAGAAALPADLAAEKRLLEQVVEQLDDHLSLGLHALSATELSMWLHDLSLDEALWEPLRDVSGAMLLAVTWRDLETLGVSMAHACQLLLHAYILQHHLAPPPHARPPARSLLAWDATRVRQWARLQGGAVERVVEAATAAIGWTGPCIASLSADRVVQQTGGRVDVNDAEAFIKAVEAERRAQVESGGAPAWTARWTASTPLHALFVPGRPAAKRTAQ